MRELGLGFVAAGLALIGAQAHAEEGDRGAFVHFGTGQASLSPNSVDMSIGGANVPGAGFTTSDENALVAEMGMRVYGPFTASFGWTSSVLTQNTGSGPLAGAPIGGDSFMLGSLTGQYNMQLTDWLRPYAGGGVGYFHPTGTHDGMVTELDISDSYGPVFQAGINIDITEKWGAYIDVKKYWMGIDATGNLSGAPVIASADIDPLLIHSGIAYRF